MNSHNRDNCNQNDHLIELAASLISGSVQANQALNSSRISSLTEENSSLKNENSLLRENLEITKGLFKLFEINTSNSFSSRLNLLTSEKEMFVANLNKANNKINSLETENCALILKLNNEKATKEAIEEKNNKLTEHKEKVQLRAEHRIKHLERGLESLNVNRIQLEQGFHSLKDLSERLDNAKEVTNLKKQLSALQSKHNELLETSTEKERAAQETYKELSSKYNQYLQLTNEIRKEKDEAYNILKKRYIVLEKKLSHANDKIAKFKKSNKIDTNNQTTKEEETLPVTKKQKSQIPNTHANKYIQIQHASSADAVYNPNDNSNNDKTDEEMIALYEQSKRQTQSAPSVSENTLQALSLLGTNFGFSVFSTHNSNNNNNTNNNTNNNDDDKINEIEFVARQFEGTSNSNVNLSQNDDEMNLEMSDNIAQSSPYKRKNHK